MEIIIQDKNAFANSINKALFLWKIYFRKTLKAYLIHFGLGIAIVAIGFSPLNHSTSKAEYINYVTHERTVTNYHNPVNYTGAIGIGYLLFAGISFLKMRNGKGAFLAEAKKNAGVYFKESNVVTIAVNDEGVIYEAPIMRAEYKWAAFTSFSIYNEYILLNVGGSAIQNFLINKNLVTEQGAQDLIIFIRGKLKKK